MAWTVPTTRSTGLFIDATIWNTDIVDNLLAVKNPPSYEYVVDEASDYSTSSTTFVDVDATNLKASIATGGGDILVAFMATMAGTDTYFDITVDGVRVSADDGILNVNASADQVVIWYLITGKAAGTYDIRLQWRVSTGTANIEATTLHPQFIVREIS